MKTARRILACGVVLALTLFIAAPGAFAQAKPKKAAEKMAKPAPLPAGKPDIARLEPRGIQRGVPMKIKVMGSQLDAVDAIKFSSDKISGKILDEPAPKATEIWVEVTANSSLGRGAYDLWLAHTNAESAKVKLYVDNLPQSYESAAKTKNGDDTEIIPASYWGTIDPAGDVDQVNFEAKAGQTIVIDLQAKTLGSKAVNAMLTLMDASGRVLASNTGFDESGDPFIAEVIPATGKYSVRVSDLTLGASKDHFYRLSIGAFPYVTGVYPIGVPVGRETELELTGYNLPKNSKVTVKPEKGGDVMVGIDGERFRSRRALKVMASAEPELVESEPNDEPSKANTLQVPGAINGRILASAKGQAKDVDCFRFEAKKGRQYSIQTQAAQRGSPVDTKIAVLHPDGRPVERLLLQAVRDSAVTFRPIDSMTVDVRVDNWEEMDLNQFLYMQGEVCKITRMPRGPDSGLNFFGNGGKRRDYFDTTASAHANEEPVYVVEPHPPGTKFLPNGLPVFKVFYENDDDGERKLGSDSRVLFTAPADGSYVVRVSDSRGFGGDLFAYRLLVHEAKPDFNVTLSGANPKVNVGSGVGFTMRADRQDGFDGPIRVDISNLPPGLMVTTPLTIQEDQLDGEGSLFAVADAKAPTPEQLKAIKVVASASVNGQTISKDVNNFGTIALLGKPKVMVRLEPEGMPPLLIDSIKAEQKPFEITIAPGQTVSAWLRVERNGDTNLVNLDVDGLPHGIIVDNIGLNGVQVRAGETEREVFFAAAKWVTEQDRMCHAVLNSARSAEAGAGKQTSLPILLKVRKSPGGSLKTASAGQ